MTDYRAATLRGELLWMAYTPGKTKGYHACTADPFEAMEMARHSWSQRRAVHQNWTEVEQTARDLLTDRQRFDVRIEDVCASLLCALGIKGFRSAVGMSRINRISGRLAAILMMIEPQMGLVISAAN